MRLAGKLWLIVLVLIIFTTVSAHAQVIQQVGPYTVTAGSPPPGSIVDDHGADGTVSFWQLPLWIQLSYLSGAAGALLVALKFAPFALLKLKSKLENRNRETIYRYIKENPGCTVNDIARGESLNLGSVRYHVYRLELARKIRQFKAGKFLRIFRNNGAYDDREIEVISALNIRTNRAIVSLLGEAPGLSNKQIADRLKIKASLAHVYLSRLVKDRIIRFEKNEQRKMYYLESDVFGIMKKATGHSPAGNPGI
jgi:predicted transcriptional regulator